MTSALSQARRRGLLAVALLTGFIASSWAAAPAFAGTLTLSDSFDYSQGKYGAAVPTDIFYDGVTGKYEFGLTSFKLTVPEIWVIGPANVVPDFGPIGGKSSGQRLGRHGLGDIVAAGSQGFTPGFLPNTEIDFGGKIKFATASAAAGLGTGRNDYSLELNVAHDFSPQWQAFAGLGRRFTGAPDNSGLRDVWYGTLGGAWNFQPGRSLALMVDGRQALSSAIGEDLQVTAAFSQTFLTSWKITLYGAAGFTPDTPAVEGGLVLSRKFSL
jgi:hypothetical protein